MKHERISSADVCQHHSHLRRGVIHCCRCGREYEHGVGWIEPVALPRPRERTDCQGKIH